MDGKSTRLLLFDIDGTLVRVHASSKTVLARALEEVFGASGGADTVSLAGKVDRQIIMELMTAVGWSEKQVRDRLPSVAETMARLGKQLYHSDNGLRPCPGVLDLMTALRAEPALTTGLLTGNMAATAPLKLAGAGLDPTQFRVGAYGSDAADRNELPAIALERATHRFGQVFDGSNTVVIGDTPADIACARYASLPVLAVATGMYARDVLASHEPDYLLEDLRCTSEVIRLLLGQGAQEDHEQNDA